jgi:hypothetical protein
MQKKHRHWQLILVMAAVLVISAGAFAADPPKVTLAVTGDAVPGATVSAKATVTITDGSTLQSIKWTQTGGVHATLANTATDTITVTLPDRKTFREELILILEEPPIAESQHPAYVPVKEHYEAGLQNRFGVVGISPHAHIDAASLRFNVEVTTTSGKYVVPASFAVDVPWETAISTRNVPILLPVLLHGRTQATYDWTLTKPAGSNATLLDANTQNPEFTPDVMGTYELTVTDLATAKPVTFAVHAGKWTGMIAGQDADGRPKPDPACMQCHVKNTPHFDLFTPWARSGHAEVFTQNVNNPNGHYSAACLSCHTVGFSEKPVNNNGIDDSIDWQAFLATDLLTHGGLENWNKITQQFPKTAQMANIQCENCHGPQDSPAHMKKDGSRKTLSSDLCGTCHGEPLRHGRYQQWQLSKHSNYETAVAEGTDPSCSKCHSAQGFIAWQNQGFSTANVKVTWKEEDVHPATCATCHDPHDVGSTSGGPTTNAKVRVTGNTPALPSGFTATNVGTGALCMTCHNGRRGLRNDSNFTVADSTRAPHLGPQADILMGQNLYFVKVGARSNHANVQDSCVTCHMESTSAPPALANKNADGTYGGTNHTFFANPNICSKCHSSITLESVQSPVKSKMDALEVQIETALENSMLQQIRLGNAVDLGGKKTIRSVLDISEVELIESHGRQGVNVTLRGGEKISDLSLATVKVVRPGGSSVELYAVTDPAVAKAGWNYFMVHADASHGAHNPAFINSALDISLFAVTAVNNATTTNVPGNAPNGSAAIGGGLGNGAGAVACTTPYVYWSEYAGRTPGSAGSDWRTDLVARNLDSSTASLRFVLHQAGGNTEATGSIQGNSQKAFEDFTSIMGATNGGALEICSDRPLLVLNRIFNQSKDGTFGQNFDGRVADLGYSAGQTVSLIGLRQKTDAFRTNLVVTNGGKTEAEVAIILYDATGKSLSAYNLTIPAGTARQDLEPFRNRANAPDVEWGFATVTVLKGTNVLTAGSMIDMKTNDPTTIPAKQ